ncbi:MAG: 3-deoxy-7-phosphoheptulonate synthase [Verrucomicrobia bacterium]|nr:3-deoxy-7-phosphoheptulonate synthase [Verrucomicrobiota bacterium]MCH8514009.1 3-deoxy-7-phosphoheptulonate synthase [Kiritimatiellia bacterium]
MTPRQVSDLHVVQTEALPSPDDLCAVVPRSPEQADFVAKCRDEIHNIIFGEDNRFLLIVGPCSIHDPEACREYATRLAKLADEVRDRIYVVMRVYFEKPRTTVGWKGLIMDPHLDGTHDIPTGLRLARHLLRDVIDLGLPTATELLDPITPQYIADLICWSAIGARTSESQTHRQMASGLSMPLGFKNDTHGDIQPAINAIRAATRAQTFLGVDKQGRASAVTTRGNPDCHIILRGGEIPNYSEADVARTREALANHGLPTPVMIDASHANCGKDHERMPDVYRDILRQRAAGNTDLIGAMLEGNLVAGAQKFPQPLEQLTYGQSITDACMDWETTEALIRESHQMLK